MLVDQGEALLTGLQRQLTPLPGGLVVIQALREGCGGGRVGPGEVPSYQLLTLAAVEGCCGPSAFSTTAKICSQRRPAFP